MVLLSETNPHPKDDLLVFHDEGHRYVYTPLDCTIRRSMTGLLKPCFDTFDGEAIVKKRFAGWLKDDEHKYGPLTQYLMLVRKLDRADSEKEVLALWAAKGEVAASAGTKMHAQIEDYLNGMLPPPSADVPAPMGVVAYLGMLEWWNTDMELTPWRTEFTVVLTAIDDDGIEGLPGG